MAIEDYPPELVELIRDELREGLNDLFLHGDNRGEEVLGMEKKVPLKCNACQQIVGVATVTDDMTDEEIDVSGDMKLDQHLPDCPFLKALTENHLKSLSIELETKKEVCNVLKGNGWGSLYSCYFEKGHKGPHSWVVDI